MENTAKKKNEFLPTATEELFTPTARQGRTFRYYSPAFAGSIMVRVDSAGNASLTRGYDGSAFTSRFAPLFLENLTALPKPG